MKEVKGKDGLISILLADQKHDLDLVNILQRTIRILSTLL